MVVWTTVVSMAAGVAVMAGMIVTRLVITAIMIIGMPVVRAVVVGSVIIGPVAVYVPIFVAVAINVRAAFFHAGSAHCLGTEFTHPAKLAHPTAEVAAAKSAKMAETAAEMATAACPCIGGHSECCQ